MELKLDGLTQEQIDSIKNQIIEYEKENSKPKDKIDYDDGCIITGNTVEKTGDHLDGYIKELNSIGLYRSTVSECEAILRKMKIEHRLRQWSKMCKDKVDWDIVYQYKFSLSYIEENLEIDWTISRNNNSIYFTDESILKRAIEDIGEQNLIDNYFVEV